MTGLANQELYIKSDSSRINRVEPRVIARPYAILGVFLNLRRNNMNVFIGCSSSSKIDKKYIQLAYDVSEAIAKENHILVYGGASYSMMGECYRAFSENKRNIIAIMAEKYKDDLVNLTLSNNFLVKTSLERIARIYDVSDAFVILPGGIGTIEELFSILEENRTNTWKKIIIFNYDNFYDIVIDWLKKNVDTGFVYKEDIENIKVVSSIEELIKELGE